VLDERLEEAAARGRERGEEAVHDVRVAARRIEAALWVWRGLLLEPERRIARRRVRRLRRRLAGLRDREVLMESLKELARGAEPGEAGHLHALRDLLAEGLEEAWGSIARALRSGRLRRIRRRLERCVPALAPGPESDVLLTGLERTMRREHEAHAAIAAAAPSQDDDVLHAARIAIKRRRYAAEAFAAGAGTPLSAAAGSSRELQRALGDVHDRSVLRECLRSHALRAAKRHQPERAAALLTAAARTERWRLEAMASFHSLLGPARRHPASG
jgi:CHAD domain-containing protein